MFGKKSVNKSSRKKSQASRNKKVEDSSSEDEIPKKIFRKKPKRAIQPALTNVSYNPQTAGPSTVLFTEQNVSKQVVEDNAALIPVSITCEGVIDQQNSVKDKLKDRKQSTKDVFWKKIVCERGASSSSNNSRKQIKWEAGKMEKAESSEDELIMMRIESNRLKTYKKRGKQIVKTHQIDKKEGSSSDIDTTGEISKLPEVKPVLSADNKSDCSRRQKQRHPMRFIDGCMLLPINVERRKTPSQSTYSVKSEKNNEKPQFVENVEKSETSIILSTSLPIKFKESITLKTKIHPKKHFLQKFITAQESQEVNKVKTTSDVKQASSIQIEKLKKSKVMHEHLPKQDSLIQIEAPNKKSILRSDDLNKQGASMQIQFNAEQTESDDLCNSDRFIRPIEDCWKLMTASDTESKQDEIGESETFSNELPQEDNQTMQESKKLPDTLPIQEGLSIEEFRRSFSFRRDKPLQSSEDSDLTEKKSKKKSKKKNKKNKQKKRDKFPVRHDAVLTDDFCKTRKRRKSRKQYLSRETVESSESSDEAVDNGKKNVADIDSSVADVKQEKKSDELSEATLTSLENRAKAMVIFIKHFKSTLNNLKNNRNRISNLIETTRAEYQLLETQYADPSRSSNKPGETVKLVEDKSEKISNSYSKEIQSPNSSSKSGKKSIGLQTDISPRIFGKPAKEFQTIYDEFWNSSKRRAKLKRSNSQDTPRWDFNKVIESDDVIKITEGEVLSNDEVIFLTDDFFDTKQFQ